MVRIIYHASHEQFAPSHLLQLARAAAAAGFDAIHSSDHFHPWSRRQGHSGFSFAWLGAAMQAVELPFSVVCAPGQRYHPAILAQAIATLAEMFPNRLSVELGSGEALNEKITGLPWPPKEQRNERLLECATIIRRLLAGEEVSHQGYVTVNEAKLYSRPQTAPLLFCAAISSETACWCGSWADGLLTTANSSEEAFEKQTAFAKGGGAGKPWLIQFSFSYHPLAQVAADEAYDQWRTNILGTDERADLCKPEHFEKAAAGITKEQVIEKIPVFTSMKDLFERIETLQATGATGIILHNVNRQHELFIKDFGQFNSDRMIKSGLESNHTTT
ncbi:TIGR03885 family FMN-dependent LLM class oxidoreductase [Longitalea arenae]|uniref:TIGR03885 family FMN-dependent LLM class oxidoreductase n=1 Tax=Longitalea arenae TaxID=2812558 RepID=UPI001967D231|nr:TIGR03885 family FMN-dependent LLM class oxidoreductase [Longitalea arenae]